MEISPVVLESTYRGYTLKICRFKPPDDNLSCVLIFKDERRVREFYIQSYKIYTFAAHFNDFIDGQIEEGVLEKETPQERISEIRKQLGSARYEVRRLTRELDTAIQEEQKKKNLDLPFEPKPCPFA